MLPFGMAKSLHTDGDGMFSSDNFITECKNLESMLSDQCHEILKTGNITYSSYEKLFLQQPHNQITRYLQSNIKYVDKNQDLHELMNVAAYIRHLDNEYSEKIKFRINEKAKIKNVVYKSSDKFMYKKNLEEKFNNLYQGPFIVFKDLDTKVTLKAKNEKS
uniref:Uncharacterized protein n=1 Tax=Strongyloides venezuelensis TaxID=75913 RepID=A0A0K0G4G0_STRVS